MRTRKGIDLTLLLKVLLDLLMVFNDVLDKPARWLKLLTILPLDEHVSHVPEVSGRVAPLQPRGEISGDLSLGDLDLAA